MSGFTGSGYPKAVPSALARRITEATARGESLTISVDACLRRGGGCHQSERGHQGQHAGGAHQARHQERACLLRLLAAGFGQY
jgi:acyl-CoA hydrolase